MKIQVTQEDIDAGERDDCQFCPIALALKRQTGNTWNVWQESAEDTTTLRANIELPLSAQEFVIDFDYKKPVKPFEFDLPI